jgi:putative flippase GtrA
MRILRTGQLKIMFGARYALFAAIATLVNLSTQGFATWLMPGNLAFSIGAGTVTGFAVKYVLDKYWIFFDDFDGKLNELRKMILYGIFSVFTTLLFWAFEIGFWLAWHTDLAKYSGALIGLLTGYWLKYRLDRAYTFGTRNHDRT